MKRGIDYIGVGVGAILVNKEGYVFLAQRGPKAKNEQGLWEFPGGSGEFGESCRLRAPSFWQNFCADLCLDWVPCSLPVQ